MAASSRAMGKASSTDNGRAWQVGALAKVPKGEAGDAKYDAILATVPRTTFPTRISDFGYEYTDDGKLVQSRTKEPFAWLGQKCYDYLGDCIINDIYAMMEERYGLQRVQFPLYVEDVEEDDVAGRATAPIFVSPNWQTAETLVILCQGSGAVRPGMWARALCINESLKVGTIFTYLDEIKKRGWAVIVCNPNETSVLAPPPASEVTPNMELEDACKFWLGTEDAVWKRTAMARNRAAESVLGCETPMDHMCCVWEQLVQKSKATAVPIIAHSFGGRCTTALIDAWCDEVRARVPGIAWTDAINDMFRGGAYQSSPQELVECRKLVKERSVNWVASRAPLDTKCAGIMGCAEVSAGHDTHEWTSAACCSSVFKFLDARMAKWALAGAAAPAAAAASPAK